MTPSDVISEVRVLINDTATPQRYTDATLLGFVNQATKRLALARPDLFAVLSDIPTTADTVAQALPSDAFRLLDIFGVKTGSAVLEVDRETLDRSDPTWRSAASGTPESFMRDPRSPNTFFLYPPPSSGVVLEGQYAQSPSTYALTDTMSLPGAYLPMLVDATVFLAEAVDDEHAVSGRAKLFLDAFTASVKQATDIRAVTDNVHAGIRTRRES